MSGHSEYKKFNKSAKRFFAFLIIAVLMMFVDGSVFAQNKIFLSPNKAEKKTPDYYGTKDKGQNLFLSPKVSKEKQIPNYFEKKGVSRFARQLGRELNDFEDFKNYAKNIDYDLIKPGGRAPESKEEVLQMIAYYNTPNMIAMLQYQRDKPRLLAEQKKESMKNNKMVSKARVIQTIAKRNILAAGQDNVNGKSIPNSATTKTTGRIPLIVPPKSDAGKSADKANDGSRPQIFLNTR